MTVGDFLDQASARLRAATIQTARLDALVLLEDEMQRDRASLLAHPEVEIAKQTEVKLNNKIAQRTKNVPLAYIRGKAEFYGRRFAVNQNVLVPRPETETMIDLLKACLPGTATPSIADIGTGSGCLGITAALELPGAQVDLYDIDPAALDLATLNAKTHKVHAGTFQENLLNQAAHRPYDLLLANLPYVPTNYPINEAAKHEPKLALFAGQDGLNAYRGLWAEIPHLKYRPAYIFTEALPAQHPALQQLAGAAGYELAQTKDLIQAFKPKTNS